MLNCNYRIDKKKLTVEYKIIKFTKIKLKIASPPRYKSHKYFDKLQHDSMLYKIRKLGK